jgi:acetylornithine deacetylase/succinyl-diaminopimelate desuccinylase-like protein
LHSRQVRKVCIGAIIETRYFVGRKELSLSSENIHERPVDLLQALIRFDTTNPPGNEGECIAFIRDLLEDAGFETANYARVEARPNLITRLPGRGAAPPLLLYGHVDVVTTVNQKWTHPPFEARVVDGYVWGRGALDMKSGVAMMLAALLRVKQEGFKPAGDIVFAAYCDEENLGDYGARFLVEEHPEQFEGVRYALSEFGGMTLYMAGRRFYPIQISEKQVCWMKAIIRGIPGHGSRPIRGGAMADLAKMLHGLEHKRMPIHITPAARRMIEAIASQLPFPARIIFRQLLRPSLVDHVLGLLGPAGGNLELLLRNTVSPTIVQGGVKINVIPSKIELQLDGRLLPGFAPQDMLAELREIVGEDVEIEIIRHDPMTAEPDLGLFDLLAGVLQEADPQGVPIPMLLPAVTDARYFSQLGIQTYGFTPMKFAENFDFFSLAHGENERIPVEAVTFGTEAIYQVLRRYGM